MDANSFLMTMVVFLLLFNFAIRFQAKSNLLVASRLRQARDAGDLSLPGVSAASRF